LAENQNSSNRTKHVDTRYHFVRQYIRDGTFLIEFVRSCDNDSDIFTKNTTSEIHHRHSEKLIWTKEVYKSEARQRTSGNVLRSIVNQSSTMTDNTMTDNTDNTMTDNTDNTDNTMTDNTDNTMTDNTMTIYDMAICNMKNKTTNILRGANRYGVLEDSAPEAERCIWVVKECVRCLRHSLPFTKLPTAMFTHIVFKCVKMLNYFPPKESISTTISPRTLLTGETLNFKKDFCISFGTYYQVHEQDSPRNSLNACTQAAICLGTTQNLQGVITSCLSPAVVIIPGILGLPSL